MLVAEQHGYTRPVKSTYDYYKKKSISEIVSFLIQAWSVYYKNKT